MAYDSSPTYADPEKVARTLLEIANTIDVVQDDKVYIELIRAILFREKGTPEEYTRRAGSGDRARMAGVARERPVRTLHSDHTWC